ncbi:GNAT family N-acetyltransferase [Nocardioides sp.]|uniref:GNAT family N-acetyltransferase n=1 Tax=Nocardioides sp. TaxID=35761 RepID=UPI002735D17C|nr:GNAT family protein [Nocardioides sp.]MDP3894157.1 GNAT family protein [Nocardioides sp.]
MTTDFTRKPTLEGQLVSLRPATSADVPRLAELMADLEVSRLTGSIHSDQDSTISHTVEQLEEVYDRWSTADDRIVWVVVDREDGEIIGESVLHDLSPADRSCGFRIWIRGRRGRGLGTEATRLTVRHAFEDQGLNRVGLEVFSFNPRARHVYEKVGFVHEGTRREALLYDGEWIDAHDMSILAREWAVHRGHPAEGDLTRAAPDR